MYMHIYIILLALVQAAVACIDVFTHDTLVWYENRPSLQQRLSINAYSWRVGTRIRWL